MCHFKISLAILVPHTRPNFDVMYAQVILVVLACISALGLGYMVAVPLSGMNNCEFYKSLK